MVCLSPSLHQDLIVELFQLGISGHALSWFMDYLSHRQQRVTVGACSSGYSLCSRGVPQGSVLGPVLFSLYVRGMDACLPSTLVHQEFADDFLLEASSTSPHTVSQALTTGVSNLATWLDEKGLLLNEKKTTLLVIKPRGLGAAPLPPVFCRQTQLTVHTHAKYLGVPDTASPDKPSVSTTLLWCRAACATGRMPSPPPSLSACRIRSRG